MHLASVTYSLTSQIIIVESWSLRELSLNNNYLCTERITHEINEVTDTLAYSSFLHALLVSSEPETKINERMVANERDWQFVDGRPQYLPLF
jgi:hypothetical protein